MKRVNTFVAMGSEEQESKEKKAEGSEEIAKGSRKKMLGRKRAGKQQQQEFSKKQKMEGDKESDVVEEVIIVDYKLHKEGMLVHYQLIRADGSSKRYSSMIRMLQGLDREELESKVTTVSIKISTAGTYYCLCSVCAAGYKDTTVADLQLLEDLLLSRG
ncbi:hypothetical protein Tco_1187094 [Tanacetum coccineum]